MIFNDYMVGLICRARFLVKPLIQYPLFGVCVVFCVGVVMSVQFEQVYVFIAIAVLFVSIVIVLFGRPHFSLSEINRVFVGGVIILFGVLRVSFFLYEERKVRTTQQLDGESIVVEGVVISEPVLKKHSYEFALIPQEAYLEEESGPTGMGEVVLLSKYSGSAVVGFGERVHVSGVFRKPQDFNDFSYSEYLRTKGIYGVLQADTITVIDERGLHPLLVGIKEFKVLTSEKIDNTFPQPHASLLAGIVYGGSQSMSAEFSDQLRNTGTTHIIAVSGYNVTLLFTSLGVLAPLVGRRVISIVSIIFLLFFMIFVGVDNTPVVRATLMGIAFLVSQVSGRKNMFQVALSVVVAILLFENPLIYRSLSFQLSFLSTIGLVLLSDIIQSKVTLVPEVFRVDVAATLAAIISTFPVTMANFSEVSIVAPLSNFFVLPVVPFITIGGLVYAVVLWVMPSIGALFSFFIWLPLEYMTRVIAVFSQVKMFRVVPWIGQAVSIIVVLFLVLYLCEKAYKKSLL